MSKLTIKVFVVASFVLLCVWEAHAAQASEAERMYARALQLHQAGDIEGAIREYRAFLLLYPKVMEARSNLGAA